ncbi:hypothetical protein Aperf_G00000012402 [Anoplocephala perfoliata]
MMGFGSQLSDELSPYTIRTDPYIIGTITFKDVTVPQLPETGATSTIMDWPVVDVTPVSIMKGTSSRSAVTTPNHLQLTTPLTGAKITKRNRHCEDSSNIDMVVHFELESTCRLPRDMTPDEREVYFKACAPNRGGRNCTRFFFFKARICSSKYDIS